MKRILFVLIYLLWLGSAAEVAVAQSVPATINVITSSACITDSAQQLVQSGTMTVQAVSGSGAPIPFSGAGKLSLYGQGRRTIYAGSLQGSLHLANPAVTSPSMIGYTFTFTAPGGTPTTFSKVAVAPDSSGNFDLCALNAGTYTTATPVSIISGPQGPQGVAGPQGPSGAGTSAAILGSSKISGVVGGANLAANATVSGSSTNASLMNANLATGSYAQLLIDDKYILESTLKIPSNVQVICLPGDGFIMAPGANMPVLGNAAYFNSISGTNTTCKPNVASGATEPAGVTGYVVSNQCSTNIKVQGCILNMNASQSVTNGKRAGAGPLTGLWVPSIAFVGVNGLDIRDSTILNSVAYSSLFMNDSHGKLSGLSFSGGLDGYHFNGPNDSFDIGNAVMGPNGDDCIANNANDAPDPGSGDSNAPYVGYPKYAAGPQTNFSYHDLVANNCNTLARQLSTGEHIQNFVYNNISGTSVSQLFQMNAYSYPGTPWSDNVQFNNWTVARGSGGTSAVAGNYGGNFVVSGGTGTRATNYVWNNLYVPPAQLASLPEVIVGAGTTFSAILNNTVVDTTSGQPQNSAFFATGSGTVPSLTIKGLAWNDGVGSTGAIVGGGNICPAFFSLSGYLGTQAKQNCTYPPGKVSGDAFYTPTYLSTVFNETPTNSGSVNGTTPATNLTGQPWVDTCGSSGWSYTASGLKSAATSGCFVTTSIGAVDNFDINVVVSGSGSGASSQGTQIVWNYLDANNYNTVSLDGSGGVSLGQFTQVSGQYSGGIGNTACGSSTGYVGPIQIQVRGAAVSVIIPGCPLLQRNFGVYGKYARVGIHNYNSSLSVVVPSFSVIGQ